VTRVEWALDPIPAHRAGLRIELRSLDDLVKVVAALHGSEPSAIELLDRSFLELVAHTDAAEGLARAEAILLVELERSDPARCRPPCWPRRRRFARWRQGSRRRGRRGRRLGSGRCATPRARSSPGCRSSGDRSKWWRTAASR
jgi:FAD/FMN-containing dehydrogenase